MITIEIVQKILGLIKLKISNKLETHKIEKLYARFSMIFKVFLSMKENLINKINSDSKIFTKNMKEFFPNFFLSTSTLLLRPIPLANFATDSQLTIDRSPEWPGFF